MDAKTLTEKINLSKKMYNVPTARDRIIASLGVNIKNQTFKSVFTKYFLTRVSKTEYKYKTENPIYIGVVNTMLNEYKKTLQRYNETHKNKKKEEAINDEPIVVLPIKKETEIERAIDLLKSNGYKIFRIIETLEEI